MLFIDKNDQAEDNLAWYDDRAIRENHIKELKDGFGADELSRHDKLRNRRVKLAGNPFLEQMLPKIQNRMQEFIWFVANGFQPVKPELRL